MCLATSEPGSTTAEVWLHNTSQSDLGSVSLRCSDLLAHDGHKISADAVRFDPDVVPLPARSSRGVTVEVTVAQDLRPGLYRGMLLVTDHPDLWLPVALTSAPVA